MHPEVCDCHVIQLKVAYSSHLHLPTSRLALVAHDPKDEICSDVALRPLGHCDLLGVVE